MATSSSIKVYFIESKLVQSDIAKAFAGSQMAIPAVGSRAFDLSRHVKKSCSPADIAVIWIPVKERSACPDGLLREERLRDLLKFVKRFYGSFHVTSHSSADSLTAFFPR